MGIPTTAAARVLDHDTELWSLPGHTAALLDALQEGALCLDAGSRILYANERAASMLGRSVEELLGRSSLDPEWAALHVDGSPWQGSDHPTVRCLTTGEAQVGEVIGVVTPQGRRWFRINAFPVGGGASGRGSEMAVVTITTVPDPTSHTADALAVRPGEFACDLDDRGIIVALTPAVVNALGAPPEDYVGRPAADVIHPDDILDLHEIVDPAPTSVFRLQHADGGYRWFESTITTTRDDDGRIVGCRLRGRDVSERHIALEALRQAEERFRLAFDMAPTGNAILLPDGRFMRVNSRMSTLLGVSERDLLGRMLNDFVRAEDRTALTAFLTRVSDEHTEPQTCELRLSHQGGRPLHVAVTASVVHDEQDRPAYLIAQMEDVTARKLAQAALAHQATHDALTALPNRTLLLSRLGQALDRAHASDTIVGLLFCDVDRFKRINDSLGHEAGDLLLVELARRLRTAIGPAHTAGRLGGDEFLIICEGLRSTDELLAVAQDINTATRDPILVGGQRLSVSLSIGVASATEAEEPATLLRRADTAMYEAKERGRDRFELYDDDLRRRARARLQIESDLRDAIPGAQLRLHHQPIVDLQTKEIVGREALIRWAHPTRGLLYPAAFLDVAEESELIVDLGVWVVDAACREAMEMTVDGDRTRMAVNVSAIQLAHPQFRAQIETTLAASGLSPDRLVIELTETSLLHATDATLADVTALTEMGVALAVDDFGTGYSSLTYLQRLPVTTVKIDRSFVADITTDPRRRAITQAVLALGEAMQLNVVAEGVETVEQAAVLIDLGCEQAQGYLFGRPAPMLTGRVEDHVAS